MPKQQLINQFFCSTNTTVEDEDINQAETAERDSTRHPLLPVDHGQKRQQSERAEHTVQEHKRTKVAVAEEAKETPPQEQKTITNHNGVDSTIQRHTTKLREQSVRRLSQMVQGKLNENDAQVTRRFPDICEEPNQPDSNFKFPLTQCGSKKRSFQHSWFKTFPWLHYDEKNDVVYCHTCIKASQEKKLHAPKNKSTFISTGFKKWKKALEKFKLHATSACHTDAVTVVIKLPLETKDIGEQLNTAQVTQKEANRKCFLKTLSIL